MRRCCKTVARQGRLSRHNDNSGQATPSRSFPDRVVILDELSQHDIKTNSLFVNLSMSCTTAILVNFYQTHLEKMLFLIHRFSSFVMRNDFREARS